MEEKPKEQDRENRDPITGQPGSHPMGAGLGAAGGGVAGAAIGAAVGGPLGAAVGAVVGGVAGAFGGRGVAEAMHPTHEESYWREHHYHQPSSSDKFSFEDFEPAYRTGYEGVLKYAGQRYEDIEGDLALDYERNRAGSALPWDEARHATRAAFSKVSNVVAPRDTSRGMRGGI